MLSIDVPNLELEGPQGAEDKLLDLWPDLLAYALGFAVIGRYWVLHHRFFSTLERWDARLVALNLTFLAWIVLIPFTKARCSATSATRSTSDRLRPGAHGRRLAPAG